MADLAQDAPEGDAVPADMTPAIEEAEHIDSDGLSGSIEMSISEGEDLPPPPPPAGRVRRPIARHLTPFDFAPHDTYRTVNNHNSSAARSVPKLTERNYKTWARDMEFVLKRLDVWELISNPVPHPKERSHYWDEKNLLAISKIHLTCEPEQQNIIACYSIARDAWDALKLTYNTKTFIEVKKMGEDFNKLVKVSSESCQLWIRRVRDAAADLAAAGRPLDPEDVAYKLLSGLPDEYRPLRTALMAMRTDDVKLDIVRVSGAILSEERTIPSNPTPTPSASRSHEHAHTTTTATSSTTPTPLNPVTRNRGGSERSRGRSYRREPYSSIQCSFCKKDRHSEDMCFLKYPHKHPAYPDYVNPESTVATNTAAVMHNTGKKDEKEPKWEYSYAAPALEGLESDLVDVGDGPQDWMLDSGCSTHHTKWTEVFRSFVSTPKPIIVKTGGGTLHGIARGEVPLNVECGEIIL